MSLRSEYPGSENYGGWVPSTKVPDGVVHFFPSPFANSACSKLDKSKRPGTWLRASELVERRFCASCVKVSQSWDRPPKIFDQQTASLRYRTERAELALDLSETFGRASKHAYQVVSDYRNAIEMMIEDGQPQYEIDAITRELHTFVVLASLPATHEHSWSGYHQARRTDQETS